MFRGHAKEHSRTRLASRPQKKSAPKNLVGTTTAFVQQRPPLDVNFLFYFFSGYTTTPPPAHRSLSGTFSDVIPLSILQHESIVDLDIDTSKVSSIVSMSTLYVTRKK
jgi:hypothetical protein